MNKWKLILLVQILTMVFCTLAVADDAGTDQQKEQVEEKQAHYCDDMEAWAEWKALIIKFPDDDNLRAAYSLRLGLCQEVKEGTIDTQRAISIFDRYMEALKWRAFNLEREARKKESGV